MCPQQEGGLHNLGVKRIAFGIRHVSQGSHLHCYLVITLGKLPNLSGPQFLAL